LVALLIRASLIATPGYAGAMDKLSLDQQIAAFLAVCRTASLATVDETGQPHAANVQYASNAGWRLYWVSKPQTAHSQHLATNPRAAISIYAHQDNPEQIHGLQLHGNAAPVSPIARDEALSLYQSKYPFTANPPYRDAIDSQEFYCFTPTWLRWIDNREHFGFKVEKNLTH